MSSNNNDISAIFKTKRTADVVTPAWFTSLKGSTVDTLPDGTQKEYKITNLMCDIYKFRDTVLPIFKQDIMGNNGFYEKYNKVVEDIIHDANLPEADPVQNPGCELFFNFARIVFVYPAKWEAKEFSFEDECTMFLDLMEVSNKELSKMRTDDEIDRFVYFYYIMNNKAAFDVFSNENFLDENIQNLGWADMVDNLFATQTFGPVKENSKSELIKLKRYSKIDKIDKTEVEEIEEMEA